MTEAQSALTSAFLANSSATGDVLGAARLVRVLWHTEDQARAWLTVLGASPGPAAALGVAKTERLTILYCDTP